MHVEIKYDYFTLSDRPKKSLVNATDGTTTLIDAPNVKYTGKSICIVKKGSTYNDVVKVFTRHMHNTIKGIVSVNVRSITYIEIIDLKEDR